MGSRRRFEFDELIQHVSGSFPDGRSRSGNEVRWLLCVTDKTSFSGRPLLTRFSDPPDCEMAGMRGVAVRSQQMNLV